MLVVTSNWCLSDGSLVTGGHARAVARLRHEVRRAALRHGFRRDGGYAPVEEIDVVFAGDTFDWLTSRAWSGDLRPWQFGPRAAAARRRVAAASGRRGGRLLATLAAWSRRGIEVPLADRRGRPTWANRTRVPVRVALLRGDRDRWLEQADADDAARDSSFALGTCWSDGRVTVLHGDGFDPLCAGAGREPTLGESLAVELMVRFVTALEALPAIRPLVPAIAARVARGRGVDAAGRLAAWLEGVEHRTPVGADVRRTVTELWKRSVGAWHSSARRLASRGSQGIDLAAAVAAWLESGGFDARAPLFDPHPWRVDADDAILVEPAPTVVFGHQLPGDDLVSGGRAVFLGARSWPLWPGFDDERDGPVTAVLATDREDRGIDWLLPGGIHDGGSPWGSDRGGSVWVSSPGGVGCRIVDAA